MNDFDEIRNQIERETEKKFTGYRGPQWGAWTPSQPSLLNNPACICNGSFDHAAHEWQHHVSCPAFGDDRAWEEYTVETQLPGGGTQTTIGKRPAK
jgi:hypothetical protein